MPPREFGFAVHRSSRLIHSQRTIKNSSERTQSRAVYHCRKVGSVEAFRAELGQQGFDHAPAIYAAILQDQPDFKLDEAAVDARAYGLMRENHLLEATDLFKLNVPGVSGFVECL